MTPKLFGAIFEKCVILSPVAVHTDGARVKRTFASMRMGLRRQSGILGVS